jgi:hypothetical protein
MIIIEKIKMEKVASEISELTGLSEEAINSYRRKALIGLGVGAAVMPLVNIAGNRAGIRESESGHLPDIAKENPYLSSIATSAIGNIAKIPASVLPFGPLAVSGIQEATKAGIANHLSKEIKAGRTTGVLGKFSQDHPYLGPALSALIPGTGGINSHLAGEVLADEAIKNKSFMSRHPYLSTYLSELAPVPNFYRSHAHAAAKILNSQEG